MRGHERRNGGDSLELNFADLVNGPGPTGSSPRGFRGGNWIGNSNGLLSTFRNFFDPAADLTGPPSNGGFRVASIAIPQPSALLLLCFGDLTVFWRRWIAG
jgi:hypothetical protein